MSDWGLLCFHRNEPGWLIRNVEQLADVAAEILVVDSSNPDTFDSLSARLAGSGARVLRVLPLGCTELFRPFAHAQMDSQFIVSVDSDEEVTEGFKRQLASELGPEAAYEVPRVELPEEVVTYHVRVYRRSAVEYRGWIHERPLVSGQVGRWAPGARLLHHADYAHYLLKPTRADAYLNSETLERPFTVNSLRTEFSSSRLLKILPPGDQPLPSILAGLLLFGITFQSDRLAPSTPSASRFAGYRRAYMRARRERFDGLSDSEREIAARIARDLRLAGGPIGYLGFSNLDYIVRLTKSFDWTADVGTVLPRLLRYRARHGRPAPDWDSAVAGTGS